MPAALKNVTSLGNLKESSRGPFYEVKYFDPKPDVKSWLLYDLSLNPPRTRLNQQVWYRRASRERHVEVIYKMQTPQAFIPGRYRIEVFVPDRHASVTRAGFAVTDRLDQGNQPVETGVTIDMLKASNEWVPLGEFALDLDQGPLIGRVRQFDDTDEALRGPGGRDKEVAFGPVRWVPLYQLAAPLYVKLDDPQRFRIHYLDPSLEQTLSEQWSTTTIFDLADTRRECVVKLRRRGLTRRIQVDYSMPETAAPGKYRVETFIPSVNHTRSKQAEYLVKTAKRARGRGRPHTEETVKIDQSRFRNQWASLGEFELAPDPQRRSRSGSLVGQVSQFDNSGDAANVFITFGPVRWVPRFEAQVQPSQQFDFPIGDPDQRSAPIIKAQFGKFGGLPKWLENWHDATPFLSSYVYGIHTGADLNLTGAEDFLSPVFAAGDGKVWYAGPARGTWNFIIVIEHPLAWVKLEDGRKIQTKVYTRYGHVSNLPPDHPILVKEGDEVRKGQQIGFIGFMKGFTDAAHLHFDVSHTERLMEIPSHWPIWDQLKNARAEGDPVGIAIAERKIRDVVRLDYLDPFDFLMDNHQPPSTQPTAPGRGPAVRRRRNQP